MLRQQKLAQQTHGILIKVINQCLGYLKCCAGEDARSKLKGHDVSSDLAALVWT